MDAAPETDSSASCPKKMKLNHDTQQTTNPCDSPKIPEIIETTQNPKNVTENENEVSEIFNDPILYAPRLSVTERYFVPYYKMNTDKPGDDMCILIHSNKICMLTLAPSHNIFRKGRNSIAKVSFQVGEKLNRAENNVSGKGKHGAQPLQVNANLCCITCKDDELHKIKACINGKLVEANKALQENPSLLYEPPHRGGYLAIVLLKMNLFEGIKKSLLTREQYEKELELRKVEELNK